MAAAPRPEADRTQKRRRRPLGRRRLAPLGHPSECPLRMLPCISSPPKSPQPYSPCNSPLPSPSSNFLPAPHDAVSRTVATARRRQAIRIQGHCHLARAIVPTVHREGRHHGSRAVQEKDKRSKGNSRTRAATNRVERHVVAITPLSPAMGTSRIRTRIGTSHTVENRHKPLPAPRSRPA